MHSRHAKINVNAARRKDRGRMIVSYREAQSFLGECAPKSNVLLCETNWGNRTAMNLIVQEIVSAILSQLRDDHRDCFRHRAPRCMVFSRNSWLFGTQT